MDFLNGVASLTPVQMEGIDSLHEHVYTLQYGGRGGGKTWGLVACCVYMNALYYAHGHTIEGIICTSDNGLLKSRILPVIQKMLIDTGMGVIKGSGKSAGWRFEFTGQYKSWGSIKFLGLHDPFKQRGPSFPYLAIDELGTLTLEEFQYLIANCRFMGDNRPLKHVPIIATSNTDKWQVGLRWIHDFFIDKTFKGSKMEENPEEHAPRWHAIKSTIDDNPDKEGAQAYIDEMLLQDQDTYESWRYGIFHFNEGARFIFEPQTYNHDQKGGLVLGIDWGYVEPTVVVFCFFDHVGDCWVDDILIFTEEQTDDAATMIKEKVDKYEQTFSTYLDPSEFKKDGKAKASLPGELLKKGILALASTNDLKSLGLGVEAYLPKIHFHTRVQRLIDDLQSLQWGPKERPHKLGPHKYTHTYMALAYAINASRTFRAIDAEQQKKEVDLAKYYRRKAKQQRDRATTRGLY